jgi:predicted nucleic acid-binding Zn finger protein
MKPVFALKGAQAKAFITSLPSATGKNQAGWLVPSSAGVKLMPRRASGAAYVSGLHRLSALKRIMTNTTGMTFYIPANGEPGPFMAEAELPSARLTLSLTAESWQGYSGEGALLASLASHATRAGQDLLEDAESISSMLEFDALIDELEITQRWNINKKRVEAALALLAVSGKLGYDARDGAYFHRELPDDPNRVFKDNPRLVSARKLIDHVKSNGENRWIVHSNESDYIVHFNPSSGAQQAKCTCTWYLNHQNRRGPCKHILAVQLYIEEEQR